MPMLRRRDHDLADGTLRHEIVAPSFFQPSRNNHVCGRNTPRSIHTIEFAVILSSIIRARMLAQPTTETLYRAPNRAPRCARPGHGPAQRETASSRVRTSLAHQAMLTARLELTERSFIRGGAPRWRSRPWTRRSGSLQPVGARRCWHRGLAIRRALPSTGHPVDLPSSRGGRSCCTRAAPRLQTRRSKTRNPTGATIHRPPRGSPELLWGPIVLHTHLPTAAVALAGADGGRLRVGAGAVPARSTRREEPVMEGRASLHPLVGIRGE